MFGVVRAWVIKLEMSNVELIWVLGLLGSKKRMLDMGMVICRDDLIKTSKMSPRCLNCTFIGLSDLTLSMCRG